jgi:chitin synthase
VFGITYNYYRKYKSSKVSKDKHEYLDKIIVHIPLYNEDFQTIKSTIDSVCNLNYNLENILILIVVDGIINNSKNNSTTDFTLLDEVFYNSKYKEDCVNDRLYDDLIHYKDNRLKIYNGIYNAVNYSVILKCGNEVEMETGSLKKGNRGKKDSALIIYETIYYMSKEIMEMGSLDHDNEEKSEGKSEENEEDSYSLITSKLQDGIDGKYHNIMEYNHMLIIDCDTDVQQNGLMLLLNYLHINKKCIAVCGQTIVKNHSETFITIVQSFEYFISHLLLKTFEHIMYQVLVLSGCFTLFKLRDNGKPVININIINKYTETASSLYKKNLLDLGEDRYLTTLIMQEHPDKKLAYISDAECYTNVPNNFKILIDQRRRWTNSLIVCLFFLGLNPPKQSIFRHIKMYLILFVEIFIIFILPIVIMVGILSSVISIAIQGYSFIPVLITSIIILLNLIITILACKFNMILRFFIFFIYLPVFSIVIPLYSIINLDNLKWGLTRESIQESTEIKESVDISEKNSSEFLQILTPTRPVTEFNSVEMRV